jgi:Transposase IS4
MNTALRLMTNLRTANAVISVGEFLVWLGLFFAAALHQEFGRELWATTSRRTRSHFSSNEGAGFGRFMTLHRFENIKAVALEAFNTDRSQQGVDPWCIIRPLITDFNKNRERNIVDSGFVVVDESMSAFRPRRSVAGKCDCHPGKGLPHLSFIERKPGNISKTLTVFHILTVLLTEPLGTELKNVGL